MENIQSEQDLIAVGEKSLELYSIEKKDHQRIGEPTKEQIKFTKKILDEVRSFKSLKRKQKKTIKIDELYSFIKDKYKLVRYEKDGFTDRNYIAIRYSKSVAVIINDFDIELIRFYEQDRLFTLNEILDNYLNGNSHHNYSCREMGMTGLHNANEIY